MLAIRFLELGSNVMQKMHHMAMALVESGEGICRYLSEMAAFASPFFFPPSEDGDAPDSLNDL